MDLLHSVAFWVGLIGSLLGIYEFIHRRTPAGAPRVSSPARPGRFGRFIAITIGLGLAVYVDLKLQAWYLTGEKPLIEDLFRFIEHQGFGHRGWPRLGWWGIVQVFGAMMVLALFMDAKKKVEPGPGVTAFASWLLVCGALRALGLVVVPTARWFFDLDPTEAVRLGWLLHFPLALVVTVSRARGVDR